MLQMATTSMDKNKRIRNSNTNVSFEVYGCLNIEEGNDYNPPLESKESIELISSPNQSDVSSFSFSSSPSSSIEPLSDFSELLVQLHMKRGLSKYYKGKSRTFTSLSDVKCVEDLPKREIPHKKRAYNPFHSPKSNIIKKDGRSCFTF